MSASAYRDVRSIAVHVEDVVAAIEANRSDGPRTVLRVTPPFDGRMRARLHVEHAGEYAERDDPDPIHVAPSRLVADPPARPTPDGTADRLRADPDATYTVETHHERHAAAMTAWREALAGSIVDSITLDGLDGPHGVDVVVLG
ncbi:hypothetical protein [Halococcus saccharolyticus]|uniref:DUF8009 domain-containing protein n=1 Tax=Halococcus saccharolyticus DSM 5350 TaxID=1227455 RepID=M0MPA0_9EURY|nr:hypothetical protein [Halococcus saccharolyticus]EMA46544.1 hypothetical protein C449_04325 [Halococcus saccharolyticus DSM 5350]